MANTGGSLHRGCCIHRLRPPGELQNSTIPEGGRKSTFPLRRRTGESMSQSRYTGPPARCTESAAVSSQPSSTTRGAEAHAVVGTAMGTASQTSDLNNAAHSTSPDDGCSTSPFRPPATATLENFELERCGHPALPHPRRTKSPLLGAIRQSPPGGRPSRVRNHHRTRDDEPELVHHDLDSERSGLHCGRGQ